MNATWYSEALLTERLGITSSAMSQYSRALKKTDRKKVDGRWFIHETAAAALVQGLGSEATIDISSCALQDNGELPPAPAIEIVDLIVHRVYPNPRLILARFLDDPAGKHPVRVKVPNHINFQPRMQIRAR